MSDEPGKNDTKPAFSEEVGVKAARKLRAQRHVNRTVWFGLGMMGLIGWSVAIPTLLGAMLGIWLDSRYQGSHSWTLMLLVLGLAVGCLNAWHWVTREDRAMREEQEENDD
ncbi:MAG TPA: F0F1 ATP synthase subunit [Candidatus Aminicenantes bacterium]|nr:F0F1 ATP synthase subunit [Candidatus Aminicenantes bacterium]